MYIHLFMSCLPLHLKTLYHSKIKNIQHTVKSHLVPSLKKMPAMQAPLKDLENQFYSAS